MSMIEMESGTVPEQEDVLRQLQGSGLRSLDCCIDQLPSDANRHQAVVTATAVLADGRMIRALGEACREGLPVALHFRVLAVAENRAKLRALAEVACLAAVVDTGGVIGRRSTGAGTAAPNARADSGHGEPDGKAVPNGTEALGEVGRNAPGRTPFTTVTSPSDSSTVPAVLDRSTERMSDSRTLPRPAATGGPIVPGPLAQGKKGGAQSGLSLAEPLGPDVLARLLHLTRRKAEGEGTPITEEEAMRRINSFFQRAFGHSVAQGSRGEGQRLIQRLTSGGRAVPAGGPAAAPVATQRL